MKRTLTCPYCQAAIEVTWRRYWYSAMMRYRCPACHQLSRIATNPGWIQYTSWLVQLVPILAFLLSKNAYVVLGVFPAYVLIFICDKKLDERYGLLRPWPA